MKKIAGVTLLSRNEACEYIGLSFSNGVPFLNSIGAGVKIGRYLYYDKRRIDSYVKGVSQEDLQEIDNNDPTLIRRVNVQIMLHAAIKKHEKNEEIKKVLTELYEELMEDTPTADSVDIHDWMESSIYPGA